MDHRIFTRGRLIAAAFIFAAGSGVVGGASVVHMVETNLSTRPPQAPSADPSDSVVPAGPGIADSSYVIEKMRAWKIYRHARSQCGQSDTAERQRCLDLARRQRQVKIAEARAHLQPRPADTLVQVSAAR